MRMVLKNGKKNKISQQSLVIEKERKYQEAASRFRDVLSKNEMFDYVSESEGQENDGKKKIDTVD